MTTHTIELLYEEYTEKRKLPLTFGQFTALALFYPVLLIVHTDGNVDEQEWIRIRKLADALGSTYADNQADKDSVTDLQQLYFQEFTYLLLHFDTWERRFIKMLKNYLKDHPTEKAATLGHLYEFARVSEGISEKEEVMIEHLRKELAI